MDITVAVIGAGSWGTTVAHIAARNAKTVIYSRRQDVADAINTTNENTRYLEGFKLNRRLRATTDLSEAAKQADVLVMGVPSNGFRETLREVGPHLRPWVPVVSLAKGLERSTGKRMTELVEEELPGHPVGVLTGPNLAKEILSGQAAAAVIAFTDLTIAERLQEVFSTTLFRVYTNTDVIGCELGGALKNIIALAAGMADGLGTGDNTRAAVMTRGLAELTRLGVAMGGEQATFAGLAGMGDLLATCISTQSRNRYVGEQLGKGRKLDDIIEEMNQVAEGVLSAPVVARLGVTHGVEMPIADEICAVIEGGQAATEAFRGLTRRPATSEHAPN